MLNFKCRGPISKAVLFCMVLQPCVAFSEVIPTPAAIEKPYEEYSISTLLNSPLKKDFTLLSQFSPNPLLNNSKLLKINRFLMYDMNTEILNILRNRMAISWDDIAKSKYFSLPEYVEKQTRIKLFTNLQFTNKDDQNSVVKNIGKTITKAGQASFLNLVAQEHADWALTQRRQIFIKTLVESPDLLKKIQEQLSVIKMNEEFLAKRAPLASQAAEPMLSTQNKLLMAAFVEFMMYYSAGGINKKLLYAQLIPLYFFLSYKLSQNETVGGALSIIMKTLLATVGGGAAVLSASYLFNIKNIGNSKLVPRLATAFGQGRNPRFGIAQIGIAQTGLAYSMNDRIYHTIIPAALSYAVYKFLEFTNDSNKELFIDMKGIAQLTQSVESLQSVLATSPNSIVSEAYGAELKIELSQKWNEFTSTAKSATFAPSTEYSIFAVNLARVTNFFSLLGETYGDLSKMMQFYGEIDAYASLAQLYIDSQTATNSFGQATKCCFVELIDNTNESVLHAKNMWHPIIPQTVVRTNSIDLGEGQAHSAVITGPNAAGKSVSMKALLVNIILGQTFGIACAESFRFTPYAKVIARMSSEDNTAAGQSKFMMEAADVVGLIKTLSALKEGEKAFVVTDELFSGTEVRPAVLLSMELCKRLGKMKQVSYILATHYKDLTKLKQMTDGAFENYKVSASVGSTGIVYPFKLTQGVGDVNVAFDIFLDQMAKMGVSDPELQAIIQNARNLESSVTVH